MKLGVGYIAFTGAEFLKPSLINIRDYAHHIVVVTAETSHAGHPAPPYLRPLLNECCDLGLIDELVIHNQPPTDVHGFMQDRCRTKREIARRQCEDAGCSHFLIRDCDEFHDMHQLEDILPDCNDDTVYISSLFEYWDSPLLRAKEPSGLYVPFIQPIRYEMRKCFNYPVQVDKGRTVDVPNVKCEVLDIEILVMHHFTACRYNHEEMVRKWQGHGHLTRKWKSGEKYIEYIKNLTETNDTISVHDQFGIVKYWSTEFTDLLESVT